jgi:hypothetical protein
MVEEACSRKKGFGEMLPPFLLFPHAQKYNGGLSPAYFNDYQYIQGDEILRMSEHT